MSDSKLNESEAPLAPAELPEQAQQEGVQPQAPQTPVAPVKETVPVKLPGSELVALRQQSGMTVEQMAARLKLTPRQILALEADNYAVLPGKTIVRGFIRAYAKVLKADPAPLVAMVPEEKVPETQNLAPTWRGMSTPYSETRLPTLGRHNPASGKWMMAVALIILLLGALLVGRQKGWLPNLSRVEIARAEKASSPSAASAAKEAASVGTITAAESEAGKLVQKELPAITPAQVLPASEEAAGQQQNAKPADGASSLEAANSATSSNLVNSLVLRCREQSWYEIRRANGNVVKSGLLQAGGSETFEIVEPVQLTLGNAAGVDASLRGAPLEIRPEDGNRVVKLNLK
ncbi:MAG: DUF4115 domain-containing protein [Burkholderiaceae bacterium]|nr:DUF4115 domain-containing protein [Burkholderiaceae bacterium]